MAQELGSGEVAGSGYRYRYRGRGRGRVMDYSRGRHAFQYSHDRILGILIIHGILGLILGLGIRVQVCSGDTMHLGCVRN